MIRILALGLVALAAVPAAAQTVKIGLVLPYTGVGAELGRNVDRGASLYHKLNQASLGPIKVEIVRRDSRAPDGASAKVAVQELIAQDKVDLITGFIYSPDAIAVAPIVTAAKKPMLIMNAGTSWITNLSPQIARVSFSMWHSGFVMGEFAAKTMNAKTAAVGYTDYPPGKDSLEAFKRGFEAAGGKVIDEVPMGGPGAVPDFTPFFQRVKDRKPDVFYVFVPAGDHATAVVRTFATLNLAAAGIKLIGPGDIVQDNKLQAMGDAAVGLIVAGHYNTDLDTPENRAFKAAFQQEYGAGEITEINAVGGWDGMAALYHVIRAHQGKIDPEKAMQTLAGWTYRSPRGPITIDPATRDIVMNMYVSEIVRRDGRLFFRNIGTIEQVPDPCKRLKVGRCGG